ncbi:MAG: SDR family oxidoreductase [Gammaproteobacteria bacterium]|jgi:short-subunit dehydrogenase
MKLDETSILITGAAGGIGSCAAKRLGAAGARLLLTDFRPEPLEALARELESSGVTVRSAAADLGRDEDRKKLTAAASDFGVDCLVNVAGINPFGLFGEQSGRQIEQALAINTLAPIQLCHEMLPVLKQHDQAHIVNVGSVFGSLGYPGFTVYSASKFAIRGFTEALRRELADTPIRIHYVAPRATKTALSTDRVCAMNEELKVAMDPPETVAAAIEKALVRSRREVYLGRPERLFGLLNSVFPGLIDRALLKQLPIVRRYASSAPKAPARDEADSVNMNILGA